MYVVKLTIEGLLHKKKSNVLHKIIRKLRSFVVVFSGFWKAKINVIEF